MDDKRTMTEHDQFRDDLVAWALRELAAPRCQAMQQHVEACPECRQELQEVNNGLALMGLSVTGPKPPVRSRERLLSNIRGNSHRLRAVPSRPRWWALAPVFAAVVLAIFAILLVVDNLDLHKRLDEAAAGHDRDRAELHKARELIALHTAPDTRHITLVSLNSTPQPQGRVMYQKASGRLVFFANNFQHISHDKCYQLWLIPEGNKPPLSAGVFHPDDHGMGTVFLPTLPENVEARAFAVTVEKNGGNATPTMPIYVMGQ
jgi:anti-sigma-K factor RskA